MAKCADCGTEIGILNSYGPNGIYCKKCNKERLADDNSPKVQERRARDNEINTVLLTTETYPQGLNIIERVEIVTAETAFGMNIFRDLFAGVRNIVGGRSEAVQNTLRDTRRTALYELKREAYEVGANAVIAVDLDYVELSASGNMVLLVASGTAVRTGE